MMIVAPRARVNPTVLLPCPASFRSKKPDMPKTRMVECEVSPAAWETYGLGHALR